MLSRTAYHIGDGIIFVNKPAGISTHAVQTDGLSMDGLLADSLRKNAVEFEKIYTVHRLDKSTTGTLAFATDRKTTERIFHLFKEAKVKKRYLFLTASRSEQSQYEVASRIKRQGQQISNSTAEPSNAFTKLARLKRNAFYELWEASPLSGKTHQIRLHAAQVGLPILGDSLYGGASFPHLCLHAADLSIPELGAWSTPAPLFFDRMGLLHDQELCFILSKIDFRWRLSSFLKNPSQCLRLLHTEGADYRVDLFGPVLWIYWYRKQAPTAKEILRFEFLAQVLGRSWQLRWMHDRGKDPNLKQEWGNSPSEWTADEGKFHFEFSKDAGLSPGLFLDQRLNREKLFPLANQKKVLNLFSYTCGFSLAAALGGASEVVSVDISRKYLEIGRKNFLLNQLNLESKYAFLERDSISFLNSAIKQQKTFDLIICDPPSFARQGKKVFQIEKDYKELIKKSISLLSKGGQLLFCTNYERWTKEEWLRRLTDEELRINARRIQSMANPLDFISKDNRELTKSFWITK